MEFGNNLKNLRRQRGLTQLRLSELAGLKQETIACYESGIRKPSLDNLKQIVNVLGCSYEDILGDDEPRVEPFTSSVRGNTRTAKMIEVFESLSPSQQRIILRQTKAIIGG